MKYSVRIPVLFEYFMPPEKFEFNEYTHAIKSILSVTSHCTMSICSVHASKEISNDSMMCKHRTHRVDFVGFRAKEDLQNFCMHTRLKIQHFPFHRQRNSWRKKDTGNTSILQIQSTKLAQYVSRIVSHSLCSRFASTQCRHNLARIHHVYHLKTNIQSLTVRWCQYTVLSALFFLNVLLTSRSKHIFLFIYVSFTRITTLSIAPNQKNIALDEIQLNRVITARDGFINIHTFKPTTIYKQKYINV